MTEPKEEIGHCGGKDCVEFDDYGGCLCDCRPCVLRCEYDMERAEEPKRDSSEFAKRQRPMGGW